MTDDVQRDEVLEEAAQLVEQMPHYSFRCGNNFCEHGEDVPREDVPEVIRRVEYPFDVCLDHRQQVANIIRMIMDNPDEYLDWGDGA